jgi:FkbM family methyltransferase
MPWAKVISLQVPLFWRYLFFIRPSGPREIWAYYAAVFKAFVSRGFGRNCSVSEHIHKKLHLRCDGIVFGIRPATDDMAMVSMSVDPLPVTRFFHPVPGDVVVDVGANIGGYALRAARVAGRVIAIEPEPSNFRQLIENLRLNHLQNLTPLEVAVSDHAGSTDLYLASDSGRHSLEASGWGEPTGKIAPVQILTLDDVTEDERIARIDWLKVDVERHELAVLRGAPHSLDITEHLILEFELFRLGEIRDTLNRHGLKVLWHDPNTENSVLLAKRDRQ